MTHDSRNSPLDAIYVREDGSRAAPALLLIHGSGSSTHSWEPLVPLLSTLHRVIRIDLLGHGRSAKPEGRGYGIPEQARRSTGFSRPGYQIPSQLVDDVRAMTYHSFTATQQASREYLEQRSLPDRLQTLGLPLLVIFGEDGHRWQSASAADYHSVTGARVEMLPGLGHSPHLEDPPRTATPLLAFTAEPANNNRQKDVSI